MPTYAVFTWDIDGQCWDAEAERLGLWALRGWIRRLRSVGYSTASVLIGRDDDGYMG